MTVGGLVLGLINIAIVVAVLIVLGLAVVWFCGLLSLGAPPPQLQKAYLVLVGLIALYMVGALILGLPSLRIVSSPFPWAV